MNLSTTTTRSPSRFTSHHPTWLPTHRSWLAAVCMGLSGHLTGCMSVPPTVEHDPSLPQLVARGKSFHAETVGPADGPVVVVVHGGPGADYRYLKGLVTLANPYRIVFYDQYGSGLSPRVPASQLSVQSFMDDLDAIIDQTSPHRPVRIVGHSWGAMLATAYAGAHPNKVERMVLAEPGFLDATTLAGVPQGGWPGWAMVWGMTTAWMGQWLVDTKGDSFARDDWFLTQVLPLTQPANVPCTGQLTTMQAWRFGSPAFEATVGRMMKDPDWAQTLDFTQGLAGYTRPVLFLRGACNTVQGEAHQRQMMARFGPGSRARLVTIEGAGHFMFNDQPDACLSAVRAFLDETF